MRNFNGTELIYISNESSGQAESGYVSIFVVLLKFLDLWPNSLVAETSPRKLCKVEYIEIY